MLEAQEQSILNTLLLRLDSPDENLQFATAQEVRRWPPNMLDMLCREGVLAPAAPSPTYICTDCYDSHTEEVLRVESPPGSAPRMYISCPSVGRVRVDPEELRQWCLVPEGWAKLIGRLMNLQGPCHEAVPKRVWWMGVANLGGADREVLLVRGLGWDDGRSVADHIAGSTASAPPALVLPHDLPNSPAVCTLPLPQVLRLANGAFLLDRAMFDFITATWPTAAPTSARSVKPEVFRASEDFRTVQLHGVTYTLTTRQAQVVEVLYEAYQSGMPELSQEHILDRIGSESDTLTLRDIFRGSRAWKTLVVRGERQGMYHLNF